MEALALPSEAIYSHGAFAGRSGIHSLLFSGNKGVTIKYGAFSEMPDLKTVTFMAPVKEISYDCFCRCKQLRTVYFNQGIGTIRCAFNDNPVLNDVSWPEDKDADDPEAEQNTRYGQQKKTLLINTVDGFNACPELPLGKVPFSSAWELAGFRDSESYHRRITERDDVTISTGTQEVSLGLTRAEFDVVLANLFALTEQGTIAMSKL